MKLSVLTPPLGAQIIRAVRSLYSRRVSPPPSTHMPQTERMARDIGLDPVEFEKMRLVLPSQTHVHPRL